MSNLKKIILPRVDESDAVYVKAIEAFATKAGAANICVAPQPDKYPDYYYFTDMADNCMKAPETLKEYMQCYREVCAKLTDEMPGEAEFFEYVEYSFYIFSVREIHVREQAPVYADVLRELETAIDANRDSFEANRFATRFEKRSCERYVTIGANFNMTFLFPVTLRCNKRCKYCMTFSPYLDIMKRSYHPTLDDLCRQLDKVFEIVDSSYGIQLAGGEPCIRQDLPDLIDYVGEHYKDRISDYTRQGTGFGIITNSSIDFSDRLIEASKRFGSKLCWLLDDYHFSIADRIIEKLEANGIRYTHREYSAESDMHCDGWINPLNDFSRTTDAVAAVAAASRCGQKQLIFQCVIANGKIYPCSRVMAADFYWPGMDITKEYSVDLFDESKTKEEKVAKIKSLLCANYFHPCDKCKGLREGRKRFYPGVQLTSEEYADLKAGRLSMTDFGNYDE